MSSRTVNLYSFYCLNDKKWVDTWDIEEPQVCPENNGHSGDTNITYIKDTINQNNVQIIEEDGNGDIKTQGFFQVYSQNFDCPGPTGTETVHTLVFPYPVGMINGYMYTDENQRGDFIKIEAGKNTIIGALADVGISGGTNITVTSTVIQNIKIGRTISLTDGTNTTPYIRVDGISGTNSTLTLKDPLPYEFSPLSPTYVRMSIEYCSNVEFGPPGQYTMGTNKIGASIAPSNTEYRITYTNNTNIQKRPCFVIEMLY